MQVVLETKDKKGLHLLDVLKDLPYVKITPFTSKKILSEKELLIEEIKEAVKDVNLAKKGKLKLKSARDLYNEL